MPNSDNQIINHTEDTPICLTQKQLDAIRDPFVKVVTYPQNKIETPPVSGQL